MFQSIAVGRSIIGWGEDYLFIRVVPDCFLLKSIDFKVCEQECINKSPAPIIDLRMTLLWSLIHHYTAKTAKPFQG